MPDGPQLAPIPLVNQQESGYEELAGASPLAMNVVIDGAGGVRRRPGIKAPTNLVATAVDSNGLDAIYTAENGSTYAVGAVAGSKRIVYLVTAGGSTALSDATAADTYLRGTKRPVLAETAVLLCITAGSEVSKVTKATNVVDKLGGPPPECTHIVANASRLIANPSSDPEQFWYSATQVGDPGGSSNGNEDWTTVLTTGVVTASARPDPILAIHESINELFIFGRSTLQVYAPDSAAVYAPLPTNEFGVAAPYSVIRRDQWFSWLDNQRRFIVSDGRSLQEVGDAIKLDIDKMTTVDDCWGFRVNRGPVDCLVWKFPTDGRTYCFQEGLWSQWSGWDTGTGNWKPFMATCFHHNNITSQDLVGTTSGKIGQLDFGTETDLGEPIQAKIRTGFINHGSERRKHCQCLYVTLRRGMTVSGSSKSAHIWIEWRDEVDGKWNRIPLELGVSGDRTVVVPLTSLGTYRRRQWQFTYTGSESIALVKAEEKYEESEF